jgi:conjugal transfer pilus assembly protein TraV
VSPRPLIQLVLVGLAVLHSTGCATQYGCKGMPDDPKCLSTTEAYQVTDKALPEPSKPESPKSEAVKAGVIAGFPRHDRQPVPKIDDPTPIRTPAQVMRIWIAPWEDSDGDLMVSGYVYTELEPRRWMIGKSAPTVSPSLIPLQIEQRPPERPLDRDQAGSEIEDMPPSPPKAPNTH